MGRKSARSYDSRLRALRGRVQRWRKTRKKCSHTPRALWEAAVELAQIGGVDSVAQELCVNRESLERRVAALDTQGSGNESQQRFIELDLDYSANGPECVIELQDQSGGKKMTIRLRGLDDLDLKGLAHSFWSRAE